MGFEVKYKGLEQIRVSLADHQRQMPFAIAKSLTKTAQSVQGHLKEKISEVFDSPTAFTRNSIFIQPAKKNDPQAVVWIKDETVGGTPAERYLNPQIYAGDRKRKPSENALAARGFLKAGEFLVPGKGARLNKFGNITHGQVIKAMSNIGSQRDALQDTTDKAKKDYFFIRSSNDAMLSGIYRRVGKKLKSFMVVVDQPNYEIKFKFFDIAEAHLETALPIETNKVINEILSDTKTK